MHTKYFRAVAMTMALAFFAAVAAFAANKPTLTIQSPQDGATIQPTAGLGNVVMIKFKADNFQIESLKSSEGKNMNANVKEHNTDASNSNNNSGQAGMANSGMAQTTGAQEANAGNNTTASDRNSTMPQSDQNASVGNSSSNSSMPQSDMAHDHMAMNAKDGHVHVTVDNMPWYWVHSNTDPVVIVGLKPGLHTVKLDLVTPNHMDTGVSQTVNFTVAGNGSAAGTGR